MTSSKRKQLLKTLEEAWHKQGSTGCLTDYLAEQLDHIDTIRYRAEAIDAKVEKEKKQHTAALKKLAEERAALQETCCHLEVHYHADAAGGSDSWDECDTCGKVWFGRRGTS